MDPVLCVTGRKEGIHQEHQILMPFISQQDEYIISPYMDYLSFFFNKNWKMPMNDIVSIMIKLADEETGDVTSQKIDKQMSLNDHRNMRKAVPRQTQCRPSRRDAAAE